MCIRDRNDTAGATEAAYAKIATTLSVLLDKIKAWWADFQLVIGEKIGETIQDPAEKWREHKEQKIEVFENIKSVVVPILESVWDAIKDVSNWIKNNWQVVLAALAGLLAGKFAIAVGTAIALIWAKVAALIAATVAAGGLGAALAVALSPVTLIAVAIGALTAAVVLAYTKSETFRDIIDSIGRFSRDVVWPVLKDTAEIFIAAIGTAFQNIWTIISGTWDLIKALFTGDWKGMWEAVRDTFGGIMDNIGGFFTGLKDKLSETSLLIGIVVLDAISALINGITSGFSSMVNFVIDLWFTMADKLMGIVHGLVSALSKIQYLPYP